MVSLETQSLLELAYGRRGPLAVEGERQSPFENRARFLSRWLAAFGQRSLLLIALLLFW
ncbi:hypothetical protein [Bradyrhizobium sp. DASA03007]|uniref:hypothetical protein n=1 Tax=unclassified Bradyrhizobium TaxID=2631580 RepID=UPI003F7023DF